MFRCRGLWRPVPLSGVVDQRHCSVMRRIRFGQPVEAIPGGFQSCRDPGGWTTSSR